MTADYAGDPSFAGSSSTADTLTVAEDATVTTVTSSASQAAYNSRLTVRATVAAAAPGYGTPTGKVAFSVVVNGKSRPLQCSAVAGSGGVALVSGAAQCVVNTASFAAPGGAYTITATYGGDAGYLAGTGTLRQQVARLASTTTLTVTPKSLAQGQAAVISVSVGSGGLLPPLAGAVTVTVTSASGARVSAACLLLPGLGGVCLIPPGALNAAQGPYTVTADYAGDGAYAPSSATATITVQRR